MIFVTLGTQDKSFSRLLDAVQKQIDNGNIKEEVIVQAGFTEYESNEMKICDLVSQDEFEKTISECRVLITHGGVGNILTGLNYNKKIIAAARLAKYGEHTNDHQLQMVNRFADEGYILKLDNFDRLDLVLEEINKFVPKKYESNTKHFCECLKSEISKL